MAGSIISMLTVAGIGGGGYVVNSNKSKRSNLAFILYRYKFFAELIKWYPFLAYLLCLGTGNISDMWEKTFINIFLMQKNT